MVSDDFNRLYDLVDDPWIWDRESDEMQFDSNKGTFRIGFWTWERPVRKGFNLWPFVYRVGAPVHRIWIEIRGAVQFESIDPHGIWEAVSTDKIVAIELASDRKSIMITDDSNVGLRIMLGPHASYTACCALERRGRYELHSVYLPPFPFEFTTYRIYLDDCQHIVRWS